MNKTSLILVLLLCAFILNFKILNAQNEEWDAQFITANAPNDTVFAIASDGSNIYIGGKFTAVAGNSANYIAKWDGTTWSTLGTGMNGVVRALTYDSGNLYAGGDFTTAGGSTVDYIAVWDGSTWNAIGTGTDASVKAIMLKDGNVYAGGDFTNSGGVATNYISYWDGTVWNAIGTGTNGTVYAIANNGPDIFVGGNFTDAGGVANTNYIAKWDGTVWTALSTGTDGIVFDIIADGTAFYACGEFTTGGATTVNHITKWDGSAFRALGGGADGNIFSLELDGSDLYIGGNFTTVDGVASSNIAMYDGSVWTALGDGTDDNVYALKQQGYEMHVGGAFANAGNKPSEYFARLMSAPIVILDPVTQDVCIYDTATFTVGVVGTPPFTYQWQLDGVDITGAIDTFITINGVTPSDDGYYKCLITNAVGTVESNQAKLTVHQKPTITLHPLDSTKCELESVIFTIAANATLPITYQWQLNTSDILGATSDTYSIPSIILADAGDYICIASNTCGYDTSSIGILTVNPLPVVVFAGLDTAYCVDSPNDTLHGLPVGGIFSGSGMTDSILNPTGIVGIHTISYTYTNANGCTNSYSQQFEGHTLPSLTVTGLETEYCINDIQDTLWGMPQDGNYYGPGMNDYVFYPDIAGSGYHQIVYEYTDKYGCYNTDTNYTTVYDLPFVSVGSDTSICLGDSIPVTITGDFGIYGWFPPITEINTTIFVQPTTNTSYSGWIMNSFGCISVDTIFVDVNPIPTGVSFSGLETEYCNTAFPDTSIGVPAGGTYLNTGIIDSIFYATMFTSGIHDVIYQYTDSNGCSSYDTSSVIIKPVIDVSFTGYDNWYCLNHDSDTLSASLSGGYYTGGNITDSIFNPALAGVGIHELVYYYLDTNACTAYDTAYVEVLPLPDIDLVNDTSICEGDTLMIVAQCDDAITYHWSNAQSNDTIYVNPFFTTTYYLTVTNATCIGADSVLVVYNSMPDLDLGGDADMCRDQYLNAGGGHAIYQWSDTTYTDSLLMVEQTGLYSVTVTSNGGCVVSDSAFITILPTPYVDLGSDFIITTDQTVIIGAGGNFDTYLWNTGSTNSMIVVGGDSLGVGDHPFWVEASSTNTCTDADTIILTVIFGLNVNENEDLQSLKIFPNPANEYFYIQAENIKANEVLYTITDITGKIILNNKIDILNSGIYHKIDMSDRAKGMYFISIKIDDFTTTEKIIIK